MSWLPGLSCPSSTSEQFVVLITPQSGCRAPGEELVCDAPCTGAPHCLAPAQRAVHVMQSWLVCVCHRAELHSRLAGMSGPMQPPMAAPSMPAQQQDYGGDMPFPAVKLRGLPFDVEPIAIARFLVRCVDCCAAMCIWTEWLHPSHGLCLCYTQTADKLLAMGLLKALLACPACGLRGRVCSRNL